MAQQGKRYKNMQALIQPNTRYSLEDGVDILVQTATAKFDETVDIAVRLGVDPRQSDQMIRGAVALPHGTGKSVRVLVFAEGDAAKAAKEAGADFVGSDDMVEKIQKEGWLEFDKAISVRSLMAKVGKLGRALGPRGLMPNPKTGTVVAPEDVASAVKAVKGGRIDFRVEKAGVLHAVVGKASMGQEKLQDNILTLIGTLDRMRPASTKGIYFKSVAISATMGPGIRLDPHDLVKLAAELR